MRSSVSRSFGTGIAFEQINFVLIYLCKEMQVFWDQPSVEDDWQPNEITLMLGDQPPQLTADDEIKLGCKLQSSAKNLQLELLRQPAVRRSVMADLRSFDQGQVRADQLFDIRVEDLRGKQRIKTEVKQFLKGSTTETKGNRAELQQLVLFPLRLKHLLEIYLSHGDTRTSVEAALKAYYQARNSLVEPNLRLVAKVVSRWRNAGVSVADLLQEGFDGLIRAAEKYDPSKGFRFSTYATCWIRQRVSAYHDKITSRTVRNRLANRLEAAEDAEVEALEKQLRAREPMLSLNRKLTADSQRSFDEQLVDETVSPVDRFVDQQDASFRVAKLLKPLNEREREIVRLRFGLAGRSSMSLREIGQIVGLSAQRVNQLLTAAMQRLRAQSGAETDGIMN